MALYKFLYYYYYVIKNQEELSALKQQQEQERKDGVVENVATVLLEYDGTGSDQDLIKALDQKYDALKDKLLLEALKKQLGNVENAMAQWYSLLILCFSLEGGKGGGGTQENDSLLSPWWNVHTRESSKDGEIKQCALPPVPQTIEGQ